MAVATALAHMRLGGARWQMAPAYALAARSAVRALRGERASTRSWDALALAASVALPWALPALTLPPPRGPFAVGTRTLHVVDRARREHFAAARGCRALMVQLWYPARASPGERRARYLDDARVLAPLARLLGLPPWMLSHLRDITTNATADAPPVDAPRARPLLIFSHGRGGYRQHSTMLVEALASRGYIVAAIDHPGAAAGVVLPGGEVVDFDPRMVDRAFVDGAVEYLADDVRFVLDVVTRAGDAVLERVDLDRVGAFGVSLGGEVAAEACRRDPRLRACLAMDVWMPAAVVAQGLTQPTMFLTRDADTMRREGWCEADIARTLDTDRAVLARLPEAGYLVQVPGMFHQDFSDAPRLSPLTRALRLTGPLGWRRARDAVDRLATAFFDRHVEGDPRASVLAAAATIAGATVERVGLGAG